jgi:hypothetical protein
VISLEPIRISKKGFIMSETITVEHREVSRAVAGFDTEEFAHVASYVAHVHVAAGPHPEAWLRCALASSWAALHDGRYDDALDLADRAWAALPEALLHH